MKLLNNKIQLIIGFAAMFLLTSSCSDILSSWSKDNEWMVHENGNIVLHTRPENFSESRSPDDEVISIILSNQNYYYLLIKDSLNLSYNNRVLIYLYNHDEALEAIGTNSGGHSLSSRSTIYYTYIPGSYPDAHGRQSYIGSKELVHLITHRILGTNFSKMMDEGYAVAFEGSYGKEYDEENEITIARTLNSWMQAHYLNNNIMTPGELLTDTETADEIFCPNAGFYIRYLWNNFGIQKTNYLFNVPSYKFKENFLTIFDKSFSEVSAEYMEFVNSSFSEE